MQDSGTTVSVTFTQKVSEAPYETADYTLTISRTYPDSFTDDAISSEVESMFHDVKMEVLRQAGQEFTVGEDERVMRTLKSGVSRPAASASPAPAAPAPSGGPTQQSVQAAPQPAPQPAAQPSGASMSQKIYPRTDFCLGKSAAERQAAWNLLAFQPAEWAANGGGTMKVYEVKEHADGTTDQTKTGKNFPNFSVKAEALQHIGVGVAKDVGLWINPGDSNVPLKVWDAAGGQSQAEAVDFDWESRRVELQQYAYGNR